MKAILTKKQIKQAIKDGWFFDPKKSVVKLVAPKSLEKFGRGK